MTRFFINAAALLLVTAANAQKLPDDFVYLRDIDPSIVQDMRYASADNFTGRALPGYGAAECVLRADAAHALKRVQASLAASGLSLKVYDCYRPARAVSAMARWAAAPEDRATKYFYPDADKRGLFAAGWISPRSMHSAGIAIDLTLVAKSAANSTGTASAQSRCDGPAAQRRRDDSLDMGTSFDCFSPKSFTRSDAIDTAQRTSRERLQAAMSRHGFKNYFREWWHYSYAAGPQPVVRDVPIPPRMR